MVINPLSDMPWDIYLDYLADQGFDQIRDIYCYNLTSNDWGCDLRYHEYYAANSPVPYEGIGCGAHSLFTEEEDVAAWLLFIEEGVLECEIEYGDSEAVGLGVGDGYC